jgi:ribosome-binding ATPase YchF (GTP1/OBG family)
MKIGLVGYKNSGKSSLFQWLTGQQPDLSLAHSIQSATAQIPESRFPELIKIYNPKKITYASIEIVDTPGLASDQHGNSSKLALLREINTLVLVIPAYNNSDPQTEINRFYDDALIADLEIILNRIEKIQEQHKKPLPKSERKKLDLEYETLLLIQNALENNLTIKENQLSLEQLRLTKGFRLLNSKPQMIIINTPDDETNLNQYQKYAKPDTPLIPVSARLELELESMNQTDKLNFLEEMQLTSTDKNFVLKTILDTSGQMTFITAGEKELRTWLIPKNGTALDAAAAIHTDMAKGFIRAEVFKADDLIKLKNERNLKAENLIKKEPKDYIIKDGDVLLFHFS